MSNKGLYSPVVRRIITLILLIGITGSFLAIYYLVYLPQQRTAYNLRIFRILHEVSSNLKLRFENYGTVYSYSLVNKHVKDAVIPVKDSTDYNKEAAAINAAVIASFKGNALNVNSYRSRSQFKQDSIFFTIDSVGSKAVKKPPRNKGNKDSSLSPPSNKHVLDTAQSLADILQPIISVHAATFESILLIKQKPDSVNKSANRLGPYDAILYKSENADIANINTDSLFHNKNIEAPVITNLDIEGTAYEMFLLPFKLKVGEADNTFVLAGIITGETYKEQSQDIPVDLMLSLCMLLIVVLLALPFMKIYFLSAEENITIKDIRIIIVVIFIIPVFIALICSAIWLHLYRTKWTNDVLRNLQDSVQQNFNNDIKHAVLQLKSYDSILVDKHINIDDSTGARLNALSEEARDSLDLRDVVFYPRYYQYFTNVHWMNDKGNDIFVWALINRLSPSYFQLSDRQYFKDIKYKRGYALPNAPPELATDSFTIQPVLSRLTGEYTINVVIRSRAPLAVNTNGIKDKKIVAQINDKTPIAVGISGKMNSVWNTVVPKGFAFCIVDEAGNILCHSDTARSLQENIYEEASDSAAIQNIISRKDSSLLSGIGLYEQPVSMLIKPMQGLPYYLITYSNKRGEYLFLLHIVAFALICISTLLLFASLYSYCIMMSSKQNTKLLFIPADFSWIRPSANKKNYYIKIIYQCAASIGLSLLFALFYRTVYDIEDYYLFTVNAALLLPLFIITGYYIVKKSRDFMLKEVSATAFSFKQLPEFIMYIRNILALYVVSVLLFAILQNVLFFDKTCAHGTAIKWGIWLLILFALVAIITIALYDPQHEKKKREQPSGNYLNWFVAALLLVATTMGVIPTVTFVSYAFREEKILQLQSYQVDLAKKIQQRRAGINQLFWKTKLYINPFRDAAADSINNLKFSTSDGIYLLGNDKLRPEKFSKPTAANANCSPFYKSITQYLFLPPDHDEFYDDASHSSYYYWSDSIINSNDGDLLQQKLYYNNTNDNRLNTAFSLTSTLPYTHLYNGFTDKYIGWLVLLILVVFAFLFYKIIYSISKRVFLIGFFKTVPIDNNDIKREDSVWLKESYDSNKLNEAVKNIVSNKETVHFAAIRSIENSAIHEENGEEIIIQLHLALKNIYEAIWQKCTEVEKYTLYDYATDGFTNYKQVIVLYELYQKGLIVKEEDGNITLMTKSFRNFLITKQDTDEVSKLVSQSRRGSWGTLRTVFYVILFAIAIFIFISQEEASKRLITIVTSLGALLPAILKLFDKSTFSAPSTGKSGDK